jgi:alpha-beta hydrolase superfamily lysophospholipase
VARIPLIVGISRPGSWRLRNHGYRFWLLRYPGRGYSAAALASVTVADFVDSVVDAGRDSRFDDVIVVGHSMAGLTLPGVAEDLGAGYLGAPVPSTIVPSLMATAKSAMFHPSSL